MKLASPNYSFELSILGYSQDDRTWRGRNSLRCEISTLFQKQRDKRLTPVQTYELARMLSDLESLRQKRVKHVTNTLSDQGLSVDISALPDNRYAFQIQLNRTLTPSWHPYPDFPVEMNMVLDEKQVDELMHKLTNQLSAYPER